MNTNNGNKQHGYKITAEPTKCKWNMSESWATDI